MTNKILWILLAVLLVAVLIVGSVLYGILSEQYLMQQEPPTQPATEPAEDPQEPSPYAAPDFSVMDMNGNMVRLSDFRGKPVVLNFWATWCYYCRMNMPIYEQITEKYPQVEFLFVNATDGFQETEANARKFMEDNGYDLPIYFDVTFEAQYRYGASSLPVTFFIDQAGDLMTYRPGAMDAPMMEQYISLILPKEGT